jgi:type I restriction enzyme S subunit
LTSEVGFEALSFEQLSSAGTLIVNDGYRTKRAELGDIGFQILRVAQVQDGTLQPPSEPEFVREEFRTKIGPKLAQPGDIILTTKGTVGRTARVPITAEALVYSPQVCFFRVLDEEAVDPDYLYYWLACPEFLVQAAGIKAQTDMADYISLRDLRQVRVSLPPIEIQREVGQALRCSDDRIELNRRMSATLEGIARTIFRSWFVDFDPVRAKMEGRDPLGMSADVAALFPERLMHSELGEIPQGWEVGTLGDVAEQQRGGVAPDQIDADTPYIALEHMPRRSIALSDWTRAGGVASNKFGFKTGEILFGKLRPYFHKVGVAPVAGVCSTDIVVISPTSSHWFGFALSHISSDEFVAYTDATSTGTRMPRTTWADMAKYRVALPTPGVAEAFTQVARPVVDCIIVSIHESRSLAGLRDALLPKLISGQIRLKDAERLVRAET